MIPDPDFNQTCWPEVEEKLGRKLLPVENQGLYQTSGMFKEWFFLGLRSFPIEEVERIVSLRADYIYGWANRPDKPERKGQTPPWLLPPTKSEEKTVEPAEPLEPFWKFLLKLLFR